MSELLREKTLFEIALENGDAAGLQGTDGSGNEWEAPQNFGSTEVDLKAIATLEQEEKENYGIGN